MYLPFFGRIPSMMASTSFVANGTNGKKLMIVDSNAVRNMYREKSDFLWINYCLLYLKNICPLEKTIQ